MMSVSKDVSLRRVEPDLSKACFFDGLHPLFEEKFLLTEGRFQLVHPGGLGIEFGEEQLIDPGRISRLQKLQCKNFLSGNFLIAIYHPLAGSARHGRSAHSAPEPSHFTVGLLEYLEATSQRHFEIILGARVSLDKHVIWKHALLDLK